MAKTLTRSELFELIWSRPRSGLVTEFGISDVAIGKHCVQAHVPGPPPGYWARKQAGKDGPRPPLPLRLPGHPHEITMGPVEHRNYWSPPEDLNVPLRAPEFSEKVEEQVTAAMKKIGRISAIRDLSSPHPALKRVLAAEAKRSEQQKQNQSWGFYKPYFDDALHQRQLRIFNSIASVLTPVTASQEVSVSDTFVQGLGTLHFLNLNLNFGDVAMHLEFLEPSDKKAVRGSRGVTATTLREGYESSPFGTINWTDQPDNKIERQLGAIVEALLNRAESELRKSEQLRFERRVQQRIETEQKREAAEQAKEKERLEMLAANREKARQQIVDLAAQWRSAHDIRDMVAALSMHPDLASNEVQAFGEWCSQALDVADHLDPMKRSLNEVIQVVELPPVDSTDLKPVAQSPCYPIPFFNRGFKHYK